MAWTVVSLGKPSVTSTGPTTSPSTTKFFNTRARGWVTAATRLTLATLPSLLNPLKVASSVGSLKSKVSFLPSVSMTSYIAGAKPERRRLSANWACSSAV